MHKQPTHTKITVAIFGALALMSGSVAMAGSLSIPTIGTGTPATSADMNSKFGSIGTAVTDNDARITTNTTNVGNNTAAIATKADASTVTTNTGNISTNTGNIGTNTTAIGTNSTNVGSNTTVIGVNSGNIGTNTTNIGTNTTDIGTNTVNVGINTTDIGVNTTAIGDHETRITTLEGAGGGGGESSADNPGIGVDCGAGESLQAAIEASPLHGRTEITISGACADDIFIRRSGITIQGATGPGTDSITGNSSGFSSDPADSFNLPAGGGALVQKNLNAAVQMSNRARVELSNLTINAGTNASAVQASRNSSLKLDGVTLNGGQNGNGLHVKNSDVKINNTTVTGDGTGATGIFAGSAVFADMNSVVELQSSNNFTGGDADSAAGLAALSNSSIRLTGTSNILNSGTPPTIDDETAALDLAMNSALLQLTPGPGNQLNGNVFVSGGSRLFLQQMAISAGFMEAFESSSIILEPSISNGITVTVTDGFELGSGGSLDMGDGGAPMTISGVGLDMRLLDHASLLLFGGSQIDMNVQLFRGSSIDGGDNSKINGTLSVNGFSSLAVIDQDATPFVSGGTSCSNGEAFKFTAASPGVAVDLCTTAE